ncbi:MAG: hypothetical protein ABFQ65_00865 [Nanoarchaeota archaeon]
MNLEELKRKLKQYNKKDIIVTNHAELQAIVREINLDEVKENIVDPEKLVYIKKESTQKENEEKYDCYFAYSKQLYHRYIIVINARIIIVTIIKINRNWQKAIG